MSRYELKELERILLMTDEDRIIEAERQAKEVAEKYGGMSLEEAFL